MDSWSEVAKMLVFIGSVGLFVVSIILVASYVSNKSREKDIEMYKQGYEYLPAGTWRKKTDFKPAE
jgi:hypothetical protein